MQKSWKMTETLMHEYKHDMVKKIFKNPVCPCALLFIIFTD